MSIAHVILNADKSVIRIPLFMSVWKASSGSSGSSIYYLGRQNTFLQQIVYRSSSSFTLCLLHIKKKGRKKRNPQRLPHSNYHPDRQRPFQTKDCLNVFLKLSKIVDVSFNDKNTLKKHVVCANFNLLLFKDQK